MKFLLFLAFAVVAVATPNDQITTIKDLYQDKNNERIISGSPAAIGQFPWQVAVHYETSQGSFFCGGSLISDQWVLTAAHCAQGAYSYMLQFGGVTLNNHENGRVQVYTTEYIVHPKFNFLYHNDIALIKLPQPIQFNDRIRPIKLPQRGSKIGSGEAVTASGWGKTSDESNSVSYTLNFVELRTIANCECMGVYGLLAVISSTVCCRGAAEHSTCSGDSGGPLVTIDSNSEATQVGVVSFVHKTGCASGKPSGYVRTESFLDWIHENTGIPV